MSKKGEKNEEKGRVAGCCWYQMAWFDTLFLTNVCEKHKFLDTFTKKRRKKGRVAGL